MRLRFQIPSKDSKARLKNLLDGFNFEKTQSKKFVCKKETFIDFNTALKISKDKPGSRNLQEGVVDLTLVTQPTEELSKLLKLAFSKNKSKY